MSDDNDGDTAALEPLLKPVVLVPDNGPLLLRAYRTRFWILLSFGLIGMCQCMNCFTLTSLPGSSEKYFGLTQGELLLIFNWQPLGNTVGALFAAGLYSTLGTRVTVRLLALLTAAGALIRCLPSLVPAILASRPLMLLCLHTSSIVNGMAGPILNTAPALLSAIWFPAEERMSSTGVLGTCPVLGSMVGFALGPFIVKHYSDMPTLLYTEAGITLCCAVLIMLHFPERPPLPPSGAAHLATERRASLGGDAGGSGESLVFPPSLRSWNRSWNSTTADSSH